MNKKGNPGSQSTLNNIPEYDNPEYPSEEDIYSNNERVFFDEEGRVVDIESNEPVAEGGLTGEDLDIPGAELDDDNEAIGEEDEENNFYSLGGDGHNDLEENRY